MTSTAKFYDSIDIQLRFLEQLKHIPEEEIGGLIKVLRDFIFQADTKQKVIYGIGEGRSALALYDFLHQLLKYEPLFPATLDDPIRRYFDPDRSNMILSASGSGGTESVINYLEDAHRLGASEILITAKTDSAAYTKIKSHNGFVFLIEDIKLEKPSELAVMGSEFELKLCTLLNSVLPALDSGDVSVYYQQMDHYIKNARLLRNLENEYLRSWIDKLLNRRGHFIVDGVGRSGFVAKALGMRMTHLGQHVYIKGDATTPSFVRGDVYIPISGSGNTREILEGMMRARSKGVDVFPIADFVGVENLFRGKSVVHDTISEVHADGICIVSSTLKSGDVSISIRPEDILISKKEIDSSARNSFSGQIMEVKDMGALVKLVVDVGIPFMVALTKRSYEDMELAYGTHVYIAFKASATHLF